MTLEQTEGRNMLAKIALRGVPPERQRQTAKWMLIAALRLRRVPFPLTVIIIIIIIIITRIAPRALDDDNLAGACKSVRDGVADALGIDDRDDPRVKWAVAQRKGKPRDYGAEVTLIWTGDAAGERQRSDEK